VTGQRCAVCGSALYLVLISLLNLGVAVIVRDSAVAIGTVLALLYLFPIVLRFIGNAHWQHRLDQWTPTVAGLTIQDTIGLHKLAITPWAGLGVLALWAAGAVLAGGLTFGCATPDWAGSAANGRPASPSSQRPRGLMQ